MGNTSGKKTKKRKRSEGLGNRFAIISISLVLASLALVLNLKVSSLKLRQQEYTSKEESLNAAVLAEEERAKELENYRIYVQTDKYNIEVAKEKLGLVFPDEILIKPE